MLSRCLVTRTNPPWARVWPKVQGSVPVDERSGGHSG